MQVDFVPISSSLLDRLRAFGVDVAKLLKPTGIAPSRFQGAKTKLTIDEFFAFMHGIERERRDLLLQLTSNVEIHQLDVATLAALHSPTFGEALDKLARYKRVCCAPYIHVGSARGEVRIGVTWAYTDRPLPKIYIEGTFSSILALGRRGTGGPIAARRVELARRKSDKRLLEQHFGCEVRFDAALDRLVLDEAVLARPLITHNADVLAVMLPGLEAALQDGSAARGLHHDVKNVLGRRMCGERPSVEKVAEEMHMSPRTLQRRLTELGTSYQSLLDDVRHHSARKLLANTDLDTSQIAFLLGFEELNSFTRAFQGWEGTTPLRWRAAGAH